MEIIARLAKRRAAALSIALIAFANSGVDPVEALTPLSSPAAPQVRLLRAAGALGETRVGETRAAPPANETSGYKSLVEAIEREKARERSKVDEFLAEHPAPTGGQPEFPYHLALYPIGERPPQLIGQPSLCVSTNGASYELWCNEESGVAAVSGRWIFIDLNSTTEVACRRDEVLANAALPDVSGARPWYRQGDVLYIDGQPFRIDLDPLSCGMNRKR